MNFDNFKKKQQDQGSKSWCYTDSLMSVTISKFFFFNWDSLHTKLNSHYEAWSYKKKKAQKRLQATENLFRKNLQLKDVC